MPYFFLHVFFIKKYANNYFSSINRENKLSILFHNFFKKKYEIPLFFNSVFYRRIKNTHLRIRLIKAKTIPTFIKNLIRYYWDNYQKQDRSAGGRISNQVETLSTLVEDKEVFKRDKYTDTLLTGLLSAVEGY